MKIAISHVYSSNNNGDAAILSAQISELDRVFDHPKMTVMTVDVIAAGYEFDGVPVINALMYESVSPANGLFKKLWLAFAMMSFTTLWAMVRRWLGLTLPIPRTWRPALEVLAESDMQVCVGGGYLRAKGNHASTIILMLLFHQIWLAKLLGKPVYLYAQSFGPYPKPVQRLIAAWGLRQADLALVRESKSKDLLRRLGVPSERVFEVPDSAFMFKPRVDADIKTLLGATKGEVVVGVTMRTWLPAKAQAKYEQEMATLIDRITGRYGYKVAIIAQVTLEEQNDDDRVVSRRVYARCRQKDRVVLLDRRFSHYEIKSVFANLDYLIGTRFHSVIFAVTAGVPAVAIEYEHKTSGIMQDLDLGQWVVPMEDVTADRVAGLFNQLVQGHDDYVRHLTARMPAYTAKASEAARLIKESYLGKLAAK
jgi:colanic acid/amylovoran biosynthesis protein